MQLEPFANCPLTDFSQEENVAAMKAALATVRAEFGKEYAPVIAGKTIQTGTVVHSYNPAQKTEVVGSFHDGTPELVNQAMNAAWAAFNEWKQRSQEERSEIVLKAAQLMKERRLEFAAWMVVEGGKSWVEADADVAEALDFLEFYPRSALHWMGPQPVTPFPGEVNEVQYLPLGVGAVIPPWNFPNAILSGMTMAPVVCGNTVVLSPAPDTSIIAFKIFELFVEAGIPPGVINIVPGDADVGRTLVAHPKTRFVSFTGSKAVGCEIYKEAALVRDGQIWLKRVVAEMGGKDAILVDSEADIDAAAQGVMVSAFGYQGQKCSACSRAIVCEDVYDEFVEKLLARSQEIKMGNTEDNTNYMGPMINKEAFDKTMSYIEIAQGEGELILGGKGDESTGYFVEPTIFKDIPRTARLACEEVFGPVLAVIKAKDFDDGLAIVNSTEYGLTGGIFTNNRDKINRAKREFHVGNLYINRKCTGALVDVQPFGGFNMSGTDAKAGGREHLLQFLQAKSICERQ